ncbi:hypothetical protein NPX13_g10173 [Xylaria arbuscula]|uniref:Uncharacterized protein n=1 Tax=Xylaria arbuscula TaxID=114810 RepID=A0A9W8TIB4_9PEZI|nr:hypothetical protein NPX13_g10173 [Xylaria arbuscula]
MAHQASTTPSIRDWLGSALPNASFVYPTKPRVTSSNRIYTSLVESIKVQEWHEARDLPVLAHLGAELDRPLRDGLAATKPVVLDAFHVLAIEANLQHFFDLSLVYCVNLALHCIYQLPVVILPHIPFIQATPRDGSIPESKSYTPDYTVFKGHIAQDPTLLTDHDASLIVGDVKLYGKAASKDQVNHTDALSWSDLGQLLWYCVCRKTRFGFCVSDAELVLMEFVVNHNDDVVALDNVVARAESELSSPVQEIPLRGKPAGGKRRYTNSTADSIVSPNDRHQHKRTGAAAEPENSDGPPASSPSLPSSFPERTSPRTPEPEPKHPYSSDAYVPSTPGEVSAQTLEDLASAGGNVMVRLLSFPTDELEHWAPALFGFISFAQLVDARGNKSISAAPVSIRDYSMN